MPLLCSGGCHTLGMHPLNKARRGELTFAPPIGYIRRPSGAVTLDPDEQVREARPSYLPQV